MKKKFIQVIDGDTEENVGLYMYDDDYDDSAVIALIRGAFKMTDTDKTEDILEKGGIERIYVTDLYI